MNITFHSAISNDHKISIIDLLSPMIFDKNDDAIQVVIKKRAKFLDTYEVSILINSHELLFWKKLIFFQGSVINTNINATDKNILNYISSGKITNFKSDEKGSENNVISKKYYFHNGELIPVFVLESSFENRNRTKIINSINGCVIHLYSGNRGAIPALNKSNLINIQNKERTSGKHTDIEFVASEVIAGSGIDELGAEQELLLSYDGKTARFETSFDNNGEKILTGLGHNLGDGLLIAMDLAGKGAQKLWPNYRYYSSSSVVYDASVVSAHNHAHKFYQYLYDTYQYKGLDGNNGIIVSFTHAHDNSSDYGATSSYHPPFLNAEGFIKHGDGYVFTGDDGAENIVALSSSRCYDMAVHELTHGITYHMFDGHLGSVGEPGGVSEFLSDLMAFLCTENWEFGEENIGSYFSSINWNVPAWRSYSDPTSVYNVFLNDHSKYPLKYSERYNGDEDNGGVHINITILGKASWLMTLGGENNGVTISSPVGYEKMKQILFNSYRYLTSQSDFHDIRFAFIQSAKDLYPVEVGILDTMSAAFDSVEIFERTPFRQLV